MKPSPRKADSDRSEYGRSVFINCPFNDGYKPFFEAVTFTVLDCGYEPRCALEVSDSGQVRIDKILKLIASCRFGIHDISRTELDATTLLPRINMPLELGLFLGAQRFGVGRDRRKSCLVLDREPYRYQKFISDIAGQDISAHNCDVTTLIATMRNWLSTASASAPMPGGMAITTRFNAFTASLPDTAAKFQLGVGELTFKNYAHFALEWLREQLASSRDPLA